MIIIVIILNEDNKILKFNHGERLLKAPFMIYADLECLLEKMLSCQNSHGKSYTEKKTKHTSSGYSLFTHCSFDLARENKSYEKQKVCYICKKEFNNDNDDDDGNDDDNKKYHKVRDNCPYPGKFRGAAHNICNLRYETPKVVTVVFYNGSTYDYHFIINQLAKELKGKLECLVENTEKNITFPALIKKNLIMVKQLHTS